MQDFAVKSAYIHIPFCKNICSYCDFCKNYYNEKIVNDYLKSLEKKIKDKYNKDVLDTLYIGGGTPSCLNITELNKLFSIVNTLKLSSNYEFTFECNYEDISEELLTLLKENKVNRISIGLQTFNKKFEMFLERKIDKIKMIKSINLAKKYFDNINIDLIYALKDETILDLEKDLEDIINLNINHISTYALIIEDHTKLGINNTKELNEDLISDMYYKIIDVLSKNNYIHYEISNFCKKGYESKHNLTYWNNDYYYGFGAGASGFINNIRYDNTKSIKRYTENSSHAYEEQVSNIQKIKDEVMLGLRKVKGINKTMFKNKHNIDIKDVFNLEFLLSKKLLEENEDYIHISEDKLFISNSIIMAVFDNMKNK